MTYVTLLVIKLITVDSGWSAWLGLALPPFS